MPWGMNTHVGLAWISDIVPEVDSELELVVGDQFVHLLTRLGS